MIVITWLYVLVMSRTRFRLNPPLQLPKCHGTPCSKQAPNLGQFGQMVECSFTSEVVLDSNLVAVTYSYYLFDSNSRNQHGQMVVSGQSVLLKFSELSYLEKYIQTIYLLQRNQMHVSKFNTLMLLLVVIQVRFWETSITRKS